MYIPFEQLSEEARIWVYQASRPFTEQECEQVLGEAQNFLAQWASHGNPLQGSATILHHQFLVLAVEESFQGATGCAVDASIQFIRNLEQALQLALLDRTQVAFQQGEEHILVPLAQLKEKIAQKAVTPDMLTFDNAITQKADIESKWLVRAEESWLGRYFS